MNTPKSDQRILVAVTGASGSCYAQRLVEILLQRVERVYLIATDSGLAVSQYELKEKSGGFSLVDALKKKIEPDDRQILRVFQPDDLFAPCASGSSVPSQMIVVPCSMGTLARIATGASSNLIERSADVMLKQKKPLIIVPRETPLNSIHLQHMLTLSQMGTHIVPAMPAFYQHPRSVGDMVDFMVGRLLELCGLDHSLYPAWNQRMR